MAFANMDKLFHDWLLTIEYWILNIDIINDL